MERNTNYRKLKEMDWPERIAFAVGQISIFLVVAFGFQVLWNESVPDVFGLPEINYGQAVIFKAMVDLIKS